MSDSLWFLGTGASVATAERDNTALMVDARGKAVLIDCPGGLVRRLGLLGTAPERIEAILMTHTHTDHVYGLPSLVHSLQHIEMRLPLYGSAETVDFCRRLLDLFHLLDDKVRCRMEFRPLGSGDAFDPVPGLSGRASAVRHRPSSLAFGLCLTDSRRELFYSGDTALHPPLFEEADRCDLLIHDCSVPSRLLEENPYLADLHTDALNLGRMAEQASVRRLAPVHFATHLEFSELEIEREIRRYFTGELILPRDLMRVTI